MKTEVTKLVRAAINIDSDTIKGYPRHIFLDMLKSLEAKDNAEVAIVTSNFKTVERINTVFNLLGKEKVQDLLQ